MKLSNKQIQIVEDEFALKRVFEPSFRQYSRRLWNVLKKEVWVTFKDGEFIKADQNGW
tara:strand:- start:889 stop:1062 length:174 start_codon:yes stop_codon:yes gene_type:complete